ncbi:PepSY domain-containing protein [Pseudactinotalea sp. Z1748]|uniref:PepSY domain-containing protein n=1 Tax=Pseudactinotalea sp. Z1748 TaxID=3413027 RepID=UPI003C7A4984
MTARRPITRGLALGTAALLLLAGCGDTEDESLDPVDATEAPPADDEPTDDATDEGEGTEEEPAETATEESTAGTGGDHSGVLAAIDLAESETGGTAFEVDDADGGNWEIYVASESDEIEVLVSPDGTEVLESEREGSLDDEDRAGLEAATITISEAIEIAAEHGTGSIDDVKLDDEDGGTFAWEVTFTDDVEVYINVADGEILRVEDD